MAKKSALAKQADPISQLVTEILICEPIRVRISDLNRAEYNPRVMPVEQMQALKASILKHGMCAPLVVQKKGNVIVGGHQRLTAIEEIAREYGIKVPEFIWAIVKDIDDPTAKQLNIALNRIDGEFEPYKTGLIFKEIYPTMTPADVMASGFVANEIVEFINVAENITPEEERDGVTSFAKSITLSVSFDSAAQRDRAKEALTQGAEKHGMKPGSFVLKLLSMSAALKPGKTTKKR